jgi:hypothetical protein
MKDDKALVNVAAAAGGISAFLGLRLIFSALRRKTRAPKRPITIRGGVVVREQKRVPFFDFIVRDGYEHDLKYGSTQTFPTTRRVTSIGVGDSDLAHPIHTNHYTEYNQSWFVTIFGPNDSMSLTDASNLTPGTKGDGIDINLGGGDFKYSLWTLVTPKVHYSISIAVSKIVIGVREEGDKYKERWIYSKAPQTGELLLPTEFRFELQWPD